VIRFGPSGIPLSCKGRTLRDGIEDIHNLGLTAMEVQLVRVNLNERYAGEDDIGRTPREIPAELIVQIGRKEERKEVLTSALDEKIEKGDVLYSLASGIAGDYHELEELGDLARGPTEVLVARVPFVQVHADELDFHGREAQVVDVLDSVPQRPPFAGQRDSRRSKADHELTPDEEADTRLLFWPA